MKKQFEEEKEANRQAEEQVLRGNSIDEKLHTYYNSL
jgi:hypothetical protein